VNVPGSGYSLVYFKSLGGQLETDYCVYDSHLNLYIVL